MYKSPVRTPKSKGIKVKHVLQVCFLLAICFWLIYQVKHSHDKKKALGETDAKKSAKSEPTGHTLKLGRKDPAVKDEIPELIDGKLNEEEVDDEETIGNDEENKNEEVTQEDGDKDDEIDEVDEHELEKVDEDDEKDGEDSTEDNSLKEHDDEDEDENIENEAREVNYKADDASSAVTQTSQGVEISKDSGVTDTNSDSGGLKTTVSSTGGREITEIDGFLKVTTNDVVEEVAVDKSKNGFLSEQSDSIHQRMDDPSQINTGSSRTETEPDKTLLKFLTLDDPTSKDVSAQSTDLNQVKNNETHDTVVVKNSKNSISSSEEVEGNMLSSDIKSNINNEDKPKKSDPNVLTMDDDVTPNYENVDEVLNDPIDLSDSSTSLEGKNDEKDLEILTNVVVNQDGIENVATE